VAALIVFRVDGDAEDGLEGDEDLCRVVVFRVHHMEGDPDIGDAGDAADVVRGAIDGQKLNKRLGAFYLGAEGADGLGQDLFKEIAVEGQA
jgi:hypothetical protein